MLETSYRLPGDLRIEEHRVRVPLDHFGDVPGDIEVFARVVGSGPAEKPYLLFLQGGPGSEAPRPTEADPGWLPRALLDYRVVMLDQRGTGRSSAIGRVDDGASNSDSGRDGHSGRFVGTAPIGMPAAQEPAEVAAYLTHFRADAIVEDAEAVRTSLGASSWSVMGQSFGGFTTLRYLHAHPESMDLAVFTGGLPRVATSLDLTADPADTYATTWRNLQAKSARFFDRFPGDVDRMRALAARAASVAEASTRTGDGIAEAGESAGRGGQVDTGIALPDGTLAGPEHVRLLGHLLGASGGQEKLHYLLGLDVDSAAFRHDLLAAQPFGARNPLYAVLQESCWANGTVTAWAGDRGRSDGVSEDPLWLAGEHITPAVFESGPLSAWARVAHLVADVEWPVMWDPDRLRAADVPTVAAVYYDDAYVPREYSLATAELLPRARCWVTNEYEHNGLRASAGEVLDKLLTLARDGLSR